MNRYLEPSNETEIESIIRFLCERTNVRTPKLKFSGRSNSRGMYFGLRETIRINRRVLLWVVAHEFAHHLHRVEANSIKKRGTRDSHSEAFYYRLRRIIKLLGDPYNYPWHKEYKCLQKMARRDGLLCDTKPL